MNKKQLVKKLIKNANESSKWITRQFGKQIIINGRCLVTDGCNALLMKESYMDLEGESACCCSLEVKKMIDKVYNMAVSPEYYIPCKKENDECTQAGSCNCFYHYEPWNCCFLCNT